MTDRDLIAEGRAALAALDRTRGLLAALLDTLEAADHRIAELEAAASLQNSYERYLGYAHGIDEGDYAEFLEWREKGYA